MRLDERDELLADLADAGVEVRKVELDENCWKIYCWRPDVEHGYWVSDAKLYRDLVGAGCIVGIPKGAFDKGGHRAMLSKDEADELADDLRAINVEVLTVTDNEATGGWEVYLWSEHTHSFHAIVRSKVFREAVHKGLTPVLPPGALDKRPDKTTI